MPSPWIPTGGGGVTAVTGTPPIFSTGGATPDISISGSIVAGVTGTLPIKVTAGANPVVSVGLTCTSSASQGFAAGLNSNASGNQSVAIGNACDATGAQACSFGSGNTASGDQSTAIGIGNTASGKGSFAGGGTGVVGNVASGDGSFAYGAGCAAGPGAFALAIGNGCVAAADNCTALGDGANVDAGAPGGFACGANTSVLATNGLACGAATIAGGAESLATGFTTRANGLVSCSFGKQSLARRDFFIAEAAGVFTGADATGDAQETRTIVRGTTPGVGVAESVDLANDGTNEELLEAGSTYWVTVEAVASRTGLGAAALQTAGFSFAFLMSVRTGGTVDLGAINALVGAATQGAGFVGATLEPVVLGASSWALRFTIGAGLTVPSRVVARIRRVEVAL